MDFNSIKLNKVNTDKYSEIEEVCSKDIAIIGMACEFSSAKNAEEFWSKLKAGSDLVRELPQNRRVDTDEFLKHMDMKQNEYPEGAYLDDIDKFDYSFFRLSPKEAALMSPNQRLFLETCWKTIEDAGYGGNRLKGSRTGVYIGFEADAPIDYKRFIEELDPSSIPLAVPGNLTPIIASRIAYLLDLRGPSMSIDTACSSALVAIHTACKAIRNGDCEMAVAGSVRINILPVQAQFKLGIESSDGRTKAFDDSSDGTGSGEGTAAILLKPLSKALKDGDNIHAVIKGSAVNQDGRSIGITAPNVLAQEDVIVNAWKDAGIDPLTISYIEAHGTGTKLGDPIEIDGIRRAYRRYTDRKQFIPIGSVKSNIGHLDNAAGIAGLIKCVLALKHGEIPPSIHYRTPNSKIDFSGSPVFVNDNLRPWETEGCPKRCGVSSFGFSGTNCHMILEEAPERKGRYSLKTEELNLLTLSASSRPVLMELVEKYKNYVEEKADVDISALCFTANTGRGHYSHRLAVVFESRGELIEKLDKALLKVDEIEDIYYSYHKLVSQIKGNRTDEEITDSEKREFSQKVQENIDKFISDSCNRDLLDRICTLYVKGADVDFEKLYKGKEKAKVSLPVYPFERKRCWIETTNDTQIELNRTEGTFGTLIDRCLLKSMEFEVYTKEFDLQKSWILKEHKISGYSVLVGTAYLEMVMQVFKNKFKDIRVMMKDIVFLSPLVMGNMEKREVQLVMNKEKESYRFSVVSKADTEKEENWSKHIEGKVCVLNDYSILRCDVKDLNDRCSEEVIIPDIEEYNDKTVFELGLRWGNIRKIAVGKSQLLSSIEIDEKFVSELKDYTLYPSLLDNALTTIPLIEKELENGTSNLEDSIYLPFSYESIRIYKPLPSKFYSHVTSKSDIYIDSQVVSFDISLIDVSGEVLVEIENYSLKKMRDTKSLAKVQKSDDRLFYRTRWVNCGIDDEGKTLQKENILVFCNISSLGKALVNRLRRDGCSVVEVNPGESFEEISNESYIIGSNLEDYRKMFSQLKDRQIAKIIHIMTLAGGKEITDITMLKRSLSRGVNSLFHIARAIHNMKPEKNIDIILVSQYANEVNGLEETIKPENAAFFGLAKVIESENPYLNIRCIDIDYDTKEDSIFSELLCEGESYSAAYRQEKRYIEEFGKIDLEDFKKNDLKVYEKGAYIITGGLGGIGMEAAKYLSSKGRVNLSLINRTKMPDRSDWDRIIEQGNNPSLINKINSIRNIEDQGANVSIFSTDVSDIENMREIIGKIRKRHGRINGVIHSAGQAGDGFLINKEEDIFDRVLLPKVEGTWILDKLTEQDEPDFFILFSSSTTLAGIAGQGDYTAANAYLDSYSACMNRKGMRALTINWSAWKETGMAFDHGVNFDGFFKGLSTKDAINAFDEVINRDIKRVFIGAINYDNDSFSKVRFPFIRLSEEINRGFSDREKIKVEERVRSDREPNGNSEVLIAGDESYTSTEVTLAQVFSEVLGIREVNIYDDFYDLGGDSIIAMKITNTVNKRLNIDSDVIDLFDNATIKEFAKYIDDEYLEKSSQIDKSNVILPAPKMEYYRAAAAQSRLYILNRFDEATTAYNITKVMKITGRVDVKRLEATLAMLVKRHEILRTSFEVVSQNLMQKVHGSIDFKICEVDLYKEHENGEVPFDEIKENIDRFIKPFDLNSLPLLRVGLIRTSAEEYLMVFDIHHIICDGTSIGILTGELTDLYNGALLPELKVQYKDFSVWQNELFSTDLLKEQEKYWLDQFKGEIPVLNLPADYKRPSIQSFHGDKVGFVLDSNMLENLNRKSSEAGTTLYMFLISAFNVLLHKYTGQEDIIIGSPVEGRKHKDLDNLVGMFVNTLALRNYPEAHKTFAQFLQDVKTNSLNAYANQDYQFDMLVDKLNIDRDMGRNPLFDVMFDFQTVQSMEVEMNGLRLTPFEYDKKVTNFDLVLHVIVSNDSIYCTFEFCTEIFRKDSIERMAKHFKNIIDVVTEQPDIKLHEIEMITKEERQLILDKFNDTRVEYPKDKSIHQIFEEQSEKTPDKTAVVCGKRRLTYRELNDRAGRLARLLRDKGICRDRVVGIMAENSLEMVIGIIGILKAGGAYLPIDPKYPSDRIKYMIEDSSAEILLVQNHFLNTFGFRGEVIDLDNAGSYHVDGTPVENFNGPDDLAYIIYTSGSTGKPKGVMVEHKNVVRLVKGANYVGFEQDDRILKTGALVFDASTFEIWGSLLNGLQLYLVDESTIIDPVKMEKALKGYKITTLWLTSPLFNQLSQQRIEIFSELKNLLVGGDVLSPKHINRVREKYKNLRIINGYGPTENTTFSVCFEINEEYGEKIPIGRPISNSTAYVLNKHHKLQPIGVEGELCVGGDGVGRGYINQPGLTLERFIQDPFIEGGRMYLTGDLARWQPDGNIEFIGRKDNQVKIRGFRIEIGEIEDRILKYESVKEVAVVARKDTSEVKYLIAYFVADTKVRLDEIREFISSKLPDYMVPSYFIQIDRMPLTINGKIDRKLLPEPDSNIGKGAVYNAPVTETEKELVKIWEEVLDVKGIGTKDNFFETGGHSLKAAILISRVQEKLNTEISLKDIFGYPTVKGLAARIDKEDEKLFENIEPAPKSDFYPLSPAQKRMYILNKMEGQGTLYNVPCTVVIEGAVNKDLFEDALIKLVERHEALRTSFDIVEGEPVQIINENVGFSIEYLELEDESAEEKILELIKPFNLSKAPLMRAALIKIKKDKHILLLDMHHIITDGMSLNLIIRDFSEIYRGKELPQLRLQYKDYTIWKKRLKEKGLLKKSEEYWLKKFEGEIPLLNLPLDHVRGVVQNFEGDSFEFDISTELMEKINSLTKGTGTTLYMLLLAAYNTLLMKYTGQEDIIVGSPVAGRSHANLQNTVGMFVNTIAMRNNPCKDKTFKEFLYEVKENALKAYENQDYPFEDIVENLDVRRDMSRNPVFDVMFILQNTGRENVEIEGLDIKPYNIDTGLSKFDISLSAEEKNDTVQMCLEYAVSLFNKETIARMADHYIKILKEVLENPEIRLSDIEMITAEEKNILIDGFNDTQAEYSKEKTIHQLFEEQVERTPDNDAVIYEEKLLTYRMLNIRSNQLAGVLRKKGVKPDSIVGIMARPSLEMIVGIMGILKAGGAYLPIDLGYPEERIRYMLEDSGTKLLIKYGCKNTEIAFEGEIIDIEDKSIFEGPGENPEPINTSDNLAYVIYTSGTSGKPKGVMIEHRGLVNYVQWRQDTCNYSSQDVSLQMLSYSFDGFGTNLYPVLLAGGSVVIPKESHRINFTHIKDVIRQRRVTNMSIVPSMYRAVLEGSNADDLKSIRFIVLAGEKCDSKILKTSLLKYPDIKIINEYGPTENTITATAFIGMEPGKESVIGRPIYNTKVYIIGGDGRLLPVGVTGELCISGVGLSRGYLNLPELTAQKFTSNPYRPGEKIYHTGDLARWLPDGNIEFIGRMDHQVKIRGFRIELGEIEELLLKNSEVKEAAVIDREDHDGNSFLCAYIVLKAEATVGSIRDELLNKLPEYMIPSFFVVLEKLPLTPNGKVDRKALPDPDGNIYVSSEYEAPGSDLEERIVDIWKGVLGVEKVGINDNFFELGGHSLKAAVMISRIHKQMNVEIPLKEVFGKPTVKFLASYINSASQNIYTSIAPTEKKEYYPLSSAQKRMFIQNQVQGDGTAYNSPGAIIIEGRIDKERFEHSLRKMIDRHETLRTSFKMIDNDPVQVIHEKADFHVEYLEWKEEDLDKKIKTLIRPFDLDKAPLLRVALIKLGEDRHLMLYDLHHIISDGVSMTIMTKEFFEIYKGKELPQLRIQYRDYALWQIRMMQEGQIKKQEEYWLNTFEGIIPELDLPADYKRPDAINYKGSRIYFKMGKKLFMEFKKILTETKTTLYMTLLASYNLLLSKYTGKEDIIIASPIAGRPHSDLENIIGMFVNMLPMRCFPEEQLKFSDFLKNVKNTCIKAYENQDYQLEMLVEKLLESGRLNRSPNRNPLFDAVLSVQNNVTESTEIDGLKFHSKDIESGTVKFDILIDAYEEEDDVRFVLEYSSDLFKKSTAERITHNFMEILEQITANRDMKICDFNISNDILIADDAEENTVDFTF